MLPNFQQLGFEGLSSGRTKPSHLDAVTQWYDPTDPAGRFIVSGSALAYLYNKAGDKLHPIVNQSGGGGAGYPELNGLYVKNSGGQHLTGMNGSQGYPPSGGTPFGTTEGWVFAFAITDYDAANGNKLMFGYGNPSGGSSARMVGLSLTNDDFYYPMISVSGSGGGYLARKATNHRQTEVLIAGRFVNNAVELWVNGELISTTNVSFNTPANSTVAMFKNPDYSYQDPYPYTITSGFEFKGRVGNCLITKALTVSERQFLEGFICWTHGKPDRLPSSHPYRFNDPRIS